MIKQLTVTGRERVIKRVSPLPPRESLEKDPPSPF
jgi:hypothetical protein